MKPVEAARLSERAYNLLCEIDAKWTRHLPLSARALRLKQHARRVGRIMKDADRIK